jgi:hypothetical protein
MQSVKASTVAEDLEQSINDVIAMCKEWGIRKSRPWSRALVNYSSIQLPNKIKLLGHGASRIGLCFNDMFVAKVMRASDCRGIVWNDNENEKEIEVYDSLATIIDPTAQYFTLECIHSFTDSEGRLVTVYPLADSFGYPIPDEFSKLIYDFLNEFLGGEYCSANVKVFCNRQIATDLNYMPFDIDYGNLLKLIADMHTDFSNEFEEFKTNYDNTIQNLKSILNSPVN